MKTRIRPLVCAVALLTGAVLPVYAIAATTTTTTTSTSTTASTTAGAGTTIGVEIPGLPDTGDTPKLVGLVLDVPLKEGSFKLAIAALYCKAGKPTGDVTGDVIAGQGTLPWLSESEKDTYTTDVVLKPDTAVGAHKIKTKCGTVDVEGDFTVTEVPVPKSLVDQIKDKLDNDNDKDDDTKDDDTKDDDKDQVTVKPKGGADTGFGPAV